MMQPLTPDTADLRFRQKIGTLRSELTGRQRQYRRKKQISLGLAVLGLLLIVAAGRYYWTSNTVSHEPLTPRLDSPLLASDAAVPVAGGEQAALKVVTGLPASLSLEVPFSMPLQEVESVAPEAPRAMGETVAKSTATEDLVAKENISAPVLTVESEVARLEPSPALTTFTAPVRVAKTLTCLSVDARQCVGAQAVFSLAEHPQPHVWMTVFSDTLPYVLKHVYYHDGEKYCEVALDIAYPRTRTWSNVTLQNPQHVGDWRVEVVTPDGTVLEQIAFQVVP